MPVWQTIATAPLNREIEVAVLDGLGYHVFAFWVRRTEAGWVANRIEGFLSIALTFRRTDAAPPSKARR